jgi:CSLREA domain-containing protein
MRATRRFGHAAVIAALAGAVLIPLQATPAYASVIQVTTTEDELNSDGDCSLREAIAAANTNAVVDACASGGGAPIVDVIGFSVIGTITLTTGQLTITDDLTINGPGPATLTLSGEGSVRAIELSGATLEVDGLTFANGAGYDWWGGGAIWNMGDLTVRNSTFIQNSTEGCGGAILNFYGATLWIEASTFSLNRAACGGAIAGFYDLTSPGSITVTDATFSANSTVDTGGGNDGGAINVYGPFSVASSTFTGNSSANSGGAINNWSQVPSKITNSTFVGNTAASSGGGINNPTWGGLTVTNSTFAENSAGLGGGIWSGYPMALQNTLVANSVLGGNCVGPVMNWGGNLQHPGTDCADPNPFADPIPSVDPLLDPAGLQDNGGPTETIALQSGSPAIDTAVTANCPLTDQRGIARPQGAGCDIGAFEVEGGRPDYWSFAVELNDDAVYGGGWIGPVDITVLRAGDITTLSDIPVTEFDPEHPGFGFFDTEYDQHGFHFLVGDEVTVTDSDGSSRKLTLIPIAVTVIDSRTDALSGTCDPAVMQGDSSVVRVTHVDEAGVETWADVPCNPDGTFNANGLFALEQGDWGGAKQYVAWPAWDTVQFSWWLPRYWSRGFSPPIDNPPVVNMAKAGQTVPVKWYLGDNWRMGEPMYGQVSDPLSFVGVSSQPTECSVVSGETDRVESYVSDPGALQYLGDGFWQFNWRTQRGWRGCRTMTLTLSDGSTYTANFLFR